MALRFVLSVVSTLLAWPSPIDATDFHVLGIPSQETSKVSAKVNRKFIVENATVRGNVMKQRCYRQKPCTTVKGCQAMSINVKTGTCTYHSDSVGLHYANGIRSEVMIMVSKGVCDGFRVWEGYLSTGMNEVVKPGANHQACSEACHLDAACRAFTWTSEKGGKCFLANAWRGESEQRGTFMGVRLRSDDKACK